jgi:hypothetical protein
VLDLISNSFTRIMFECLINLSTKEIQVTSAFRVYGVNYINTLTWRGNNDYTCLKDNKVEA